MTIKGYLFYEEGSLAVSIPKALIARYNTFESLIEDLNYVLEQAKIDEAITLSGYLLFNMDS